MRNVPTSTIVAIRPSIGARPTDPLRYTYYWLGMVLDEARSRGFSTVDLHDELARKESVVPMLRQLAMKGPLFVIGSGHGHSGILTGQNLATVLDESTRINLNNSVIYLMSCSTAQSLGRHLIEECSASAFIGYSQEYLISRDDIEDMEFHPDVQSYMQLFTVPALTLIWGGSTRDGASNAHRTFAAWRRYYETKFAAPGGNRPENALAIQRLEHDAGALRVLGDDVYIAPVYKKLNVEPNVPAVG